VGNIDPDTCLFQQPQKIDWKHGLLFLMPVDRKYPPDTVWTDEESAAHEAEGRGLWRLLRTELGPNFRVAHHSAKDGRVLEQEQDADAS
jgi:hypothetical protein